MTYIFIILILFSIHCILKSFFNKYSWFLTAIIWSLIGLMYVSFLLTSITGSYSSTGYIFGRYDIKLFMHLVKNRIHYFSLIRMYNWISGIYFIMCFLFIKTYVSQGKRKIPKELVTIIFVAVFSASYAIFYDPYISLLLYTNSIKEGTWFYNLVCIFDLFMYVGMIIVLLYPILLLYLRRTQIITTYKKRQFIGVCIFIFLIHTLYIILLLISSIRHPYFLGIPNDIISAQAYKANIKREYLIYVILMFVVMIINFYITTRFNIFRTEGVIKSYFNKQKNRILNKNVFQTFHGVKNMVLSHKVMLNTAQNTSGKEKDMMLENLNRKMEEYIYHISSMLDSNNLLQNEYLREKVYVSDILDDVVNRLSVPEDVIVTKLYKEKAEQIYVDSFYFTDAIYNIVENAVQAVEKTQNTKKEVKISIENEFSWIVIIVTDSGDGMDKKTQKHIFEPFFSTKSRINNWGIGLYFTKNVITQHNGNISIQSKKGKGTIFYILMQPCAEEAIENKSYDI